MTMGGFLISLLVVVFLFLLMGVRVVRQGYVYTIERLGKYSLPANPGLHQDQHDGAGAGYSGTRNYHQG
jgi:regulator of protease activity HflC (stomatin/prohibitin superfamily)